MRRFLSFILSAVVLGSGLSQRPNPSPPAKPLSAPTYYIALTVRSCDPTFVEFRGASNLPTGSMLGLMVNDFDGNGWREYSDEVFVPLNESGFFDGRVRPKKDMRFHKNLILIAEFTTFRPPQRQSVLQIVGKHGEHLGDFDNPQLGQVSGPYYLLDTIARIGFCGEGIDKGSKKQN